MSIEFSPPNDTFLETIRPALMRFFPVLMLLAAYGSIMAEKSSRMYWPYLDLVLRSRVLSTFFTKPDARARSRCPLSAIIFFPVTYGCTGRRCMTARCS